MYHLLRIAGSSQPAGAANAKETLDAVMAAAVAAPTPDWDDDELMGDEELSRRLQAQRQQPQQEQQLQ